MPANATYGPSMDPRLEYAYLARSATLNADSTIDVTQGNISAFTVTGDSQEQVFPLPLSIAVVGMFHWESNEASDSAIGPVVTVTYVSDSSSLPIGNSEVSGVLTGMPPSLFVVNSTPVFPEPMQCTAVLNIGGTLIARLPLAITHIPDYPRS